MQGNAKVPAFLELAQWQRGVMRRVTLIAVVGVLGATGVSYMALRTAYMAMDKDMSLIVIGSDGLPTLYDNTQKHRYSLDNTRVEAFCKMFMRYFTGIDSGNLDKDFQEAMNMMTPLLRDRTRADPKQAERRRRYIGANIRTMFEDVDVVIGPYDANDMRASFRTTVTAKLRYVPLFGDSEAVDNDAAEEEYVMTDLRLRRESVSPAHIFGLSVHWFRVERYRTAKELHERLQELSE